MMEKCYLAVDSAHPHQVLEKVGLVWDVGGVWGIKLNLDTIMKDDNIIRKVRDEFGRPIFADVKMFNGERTMCEIVQMLADQGATVTNAHALDDYLLEKPAQLASDLGMEFLAVTVLTHFSEDYCLKFFDAGIAFTVRQMVGQALSRGCSGYILPGPMLGAVKDLPGKRLVPAIRTAGANWKSNNQQQAVTPEEAFYNGADSIVVGSAVFQAPDPKQAFTDILKGIGAL